MQDRAILPMPIAPALAYGAVACEPGLSYMRTCLRGRVGCIAWRIDFGGPRRDLLLG
jgi:hypothetical protein